MCLSNSRVWKPWDSTQEGVTEAPLACAFGHMQPLTEGRIRPHGHDHLFFFCTDCMKAKNTTPGCCPAFAFPSKYMETSLPSKTTYLEDDGSLVTPIISLFPNLFSLLPHLLSLISHTASGLGTVSSIRTGSSECLAIMWFWIFSPTRVFIHLGIPNSKAGWPAVPSQKLVQSGMKEPRRKLSLFHIFTWKKRSITSPFSPLFGYRCTQTSATWAQGTQLMPWN